MEYAVIRTGGKQYKVTPGQTIEVDKLITDGKSIVLSDVLLWVNDGKAQIGKPLLSGVSVKAKVLGEKKGEKIRVSKFKSKVRYRKTIGFRAKLSVLEIEGIDSGSKKAASKPSSEKTAESKQFSP